MEAKFTTAVRLNFISDMAVSRWRQSVPIYTDDHENWSTQAMLLYSAYQSMQLLRRAPG